jgi:exonuclease SbcD
MVCTCCGSTGFDTEEGTHSIPMAKFLHIADIHLGIRRYRSEDRTRDFFFAWQDVLERYAIREKVDFVLIAGDFFDARRVDPQAMNHAMVGLNRLREAGIPVVAIEGNHDCHEVDNPFSWLRSLSQWGLLHLLEPFHEVGTVTLRPWDERSRKGSFLDLAGVRIFGSLWYGSTVSHALGGLIESLQTASQSDQFQVMMLHTDVEGQLQRPIPALPVARLAELRSRIDYLALGHTHKNFEIDGWVYNPGSLEACNVEEYFHRRGAYLVETDGRSHRARLVEEYYRRPIVRLALEISGFPTPETLFEGLMSRLREAGPSVSAEGEARLAPVLELTLRGRLLFPTSQLELPRYREEILRVFEPLLVMIRNQTVPAEYGVALGLSGNVSRSERERRVIEDLLSREDRYRDQAASLAGMILETKQLALAGEAPERILALLAEQQEEASLP